MKTITNHIDCFFIRYGKTFNIVDFFRCKETVYDLEKKWLKWLKWYYQREYIDLIRFLFSRKDALTLRVRAFRSTQGIRKLGRKL